jgi:two-component system, chemotaxis family, sensor kinase CheA
MKTNDQEFIKRLRTTFHAEAQEHLQTISSLLMELEKAPPADRRAVVIENAYREAHSLKGASRAVDLSDIESICQGVEGVFSTWKQQPPDLSAETFNTLHQALDSIRALIDAIKTGPAEIDRPRRDELIGNLNRLHSPTQSTRTVEVERAASVHRVEPAPLPSAPANLERNAAIETVRIPTAQLDARLLQAEEMLTLKATAVQRAAGIREMTRSVDRWWKEWSRIAPDVRALRRATNHEPGAGADEASLSSFTALAHFLDWNCDHFRSLESKLGALLAESEQDRRSVNKQVDDLLDNSKKLIMLPFSTVTDLLFKVVRDLCRDQGKEADLTIEGGDIGIDKRILDATKDAIIHCLRNCIDHGVEKPDERKRLKKSPRAAVTIAVSQVNGDKVEIRISDDGCGIDTEKVKRAAVAQGVLSEAQSHELNDEEALGLIFHSGVSTSAIITEISGRGLGMAIVRANAEKLGGRVSVQSQRNVGTTLRMTLPLTLATFRGIVVSAAGQVFVLPTVSVERVLRVKPSEIQTLENRETISLQNRAVSLVRLNAVLQLCAKAKGGDDSVPIPVVVLHAGDEQIAFAVEEVLGEEEVLVKPFQKPLKRVRNIAGATVLRSGKAAPVLMIADLMKSAKTGGAAPVSTATKDEERAAALKRVLVVEDSITSRTLLKGILETASYQVRTAVDGVDAFTVLREERFDLVVSDVEMPRMNGLDLTARIRADDRLAALPVVLVTALESPQERERGIDVGANAYLVKSNFDQSNLLEAVRRFI